MTPITFWFDPISPYAYLAFERLPQALAGHSYVVRYRPVLLVGLLKHWGQRGPAEIAPKRAWSYRQIAWLARRDGITLDLPSQHPFNPLALLRLLVAAGQDGEPNRWQCEQVLRHVWTGGGAADDPQRLLALSQTLAPPRDPADAAVKERLREHTDAAIAGGVFGVPTLQLEDPAGGPSKAFWGADALEMVAGCLSGDDFFGAAWDEAAGRPQALVRGT